MHPVYSLRRFVHPHADLGVVCRSALRHVSAGVLHHVHDSRQSPCSTTPQLVLSLPSEMLGTPLSHLHAQFGPKSLKEVSTLRRCHTRRKLRRHSEAPIQVCNLTQRSRRMGREHSLPRAPFYPSNWLIETRHNDYIDQLEFFRNMYQTQNLKEGRRNLKFRCRTAAALLL